MNTPEKKNILDGTNKALATWVVTSLIFIMSVLVIILVTSFTKSDETREANFAVLDIEEAIGSTVTKRLASVSDKDEVKMIVSEGRKQVESWLSTRLEAHCAAPCVVFKRGDVVFGDVVDLNVQYERETAEALMNQSDRFSSLNGK